MQLIRSIESPTNPEFPPATNQITITDVSFGPPPLFYVILQKKDGDEVTFLGDRKVCMTQEQWDNWGAESSAEYVPPCVAEILGLTLL